MQQAVVQMRERRAIDLETGSRREDLYTTMHKAMRAMLCDVLVAAGRMDCADEGEVAEVLGRVRRMIELSRHHLHHENQHVHPVLESRRRGSASLAAREHTEHEHAFELLEALVRRVERNQGPAREAAALDLYRELALFAAEDFRHMHAEETVNNAVLWAQCSDEQLKAVHHAIVAAMNPQLAAESLRWIVPSISTAERAGLLSDLRHGMPSEAFAGVLQLVRSVLGEREWSKLLSALGERPLTC